MDSSIAGWLVIVLALIGANLPFVNDKLMLVIPVGKDAAGRKSLWWRLLELVIFYFAVGFVARILEANAGNTFAQRWEFYAVTASLFLVFAFPGFVLRYLLRSRS